jgi:ribonuclease VapC
MIVDSSTVLAIFFEEPEAPDLVARLRAAGAKRISAVSYLECATKLDNAAEGASMELDAFLADAGIELAPVTPAQARAARWRTGRGRHRAGLNLGDCFARETGEPLLAKVDDFPATDLALVR